jgi:nucleoside-diphosphate-sugar epimerase
MNQLAAQRVAVTGATGFIGLHLCRSLLRSGAEVFAICRTEPGILHERLHWRQADLTDFQCTQKAFRGLQDSLVFHLCSYAQGERDLAMVLPTFQGELVTSVNVLTAVADIGVSRIVMAGSMEEPGLGEIASSPYAAAKAASRAYGAMFHRLHRVPVVMTRIFMTYGPGQAAKKVIPHTIISLIQGRPLKITTSRRLVDWIFVDDVVHGLLAVASTSGMEGNSLDIGSGELIEIGDVVRRICALVRPDAPVEFGSTSEGAVEQVQRADVARTSALTGWYPTVSLDDGLKLTVEYLTRSGG